MQGLVIPIEAKSEENHFFRQVLTTTEHFQIVVMSLHPLEDIGEETHATVDQFLRIEEGEASVVLDGEEQSAQAGDAIVVPAGVRHNIINRSPDKPLQLYTIYAPPQHPDGTIHQTKAEAMADENDHR